MNRTIPIAGQARLQPTGAAQLMPTGPTPWPQHAIDSRALQQMQNLQAQQQNLQPGYVEVKAKQGLLAQQAQWPPPPPPPTPATHPVDRILERLDILADVLRELRAHGEGMAKHLVEVTARMQRLEEHLEALELQKAPATPTTAILEPAPSSGRQHSPLPSRALLSRW